MSSFRKIYKKLWSDERFRDLDVTSKLLYLYLLTGKEASIIPGFVDASEATLSNRIGKDLESFREAFRNLSGNDLARADWVAGVVFLPLAIHDNRPASPNVILSWKSALEELPNCPLKNEACQELTAVLECIGESFSKPFTKLLQSFGERFPLKVECRKKKVESRKYIPNDSVRSENQDQPREVSQDLKVSGESSPKEKLDASKTSPSKFPKRPPSTKGFDPERLKKAKAEANTRTLKPKATEQPRPEAADEKVVDLGFFNLPNEQERSAMIADLEGARGDHLAKKLKKQLCKEVISAFREVRTAATGNGFIDVREAGERAAEVIGKACVGYAVNPLDIFNYWRDPANNFTKMKYPTLIFMAKESNLEQAVAVLRPAKPGAPVGTKAKSGEPTTRKGLGFAYDANELHPELKKILKKSGFDLTGLDGSRLMTIQNAGIRVADGQDDAICNDTLLEQARAVAHLFKREDR